MASENTVVKNIRAPQAAFDRLKALTDESFPNQGAALEALLNSWEMQIAKAAIPSREADISDFDSHLQAIQRAFMHSLEVAENAENRARDAFRRQVETLEAEKAELRERMTRAEAEARAAASERESALTSAREANKRADAAERHAAALEKSLETEKANAAAQIEDKQRLIDSLTAQLTEAHKDAKAAEETAKEADSLKRRLAEAKQELTDAQTAATVAAAKATATQAEAVAAVQKETSAQLLKLMGDKGALQAEVERLKAKIMLLESPKEARAAANAAPMNDEPTPPTPAKDTSNAAKRQKSTAKDKTNATKENQQ